MRSALTSCLVLLMWLGAGSARAQPPVVPGSIQARVQAEFADQTFATKIVIWNALQRSGRGPGTLVDTEVYPNGTRKALLADTAAPGDVAPDAEPADGGQLHFIKAGTRVRVVSIEIRNDQVALLLRTVPDKFYGKLRFIYGKGWASAMSYDQILAVAAECVAIERLERRQALDAEQTQLGEQLAVARAPMPADAPTTLLIERGGRIRELLRSLLANRAEFEKATGAPDKPAADEYTRALAVIESELARLETLHRREQVADLKDELIASQKEAARLKPRVEKKPESFTNWKFLDETLRQWVGTIDARRSFYARLAELGDTVSPDDLKALDAEQEATQARRTALDKARGPLELVDLAEEYRAQTARRAELQAALAKAPAGKKDEAAQAVIEHVQKMIGNREAAERAGLKTAAAQAAELRKALDKLKSPPAGPQTAAAGL